MRVLSSGCNRLAGSAPVPAIVLLGVLMFCFAASAVSAASDVSAKSAIPAQRPNIIVILADDMGWNDVGYHGSDIRTPNIDALASDGMRLHRFYSQPTCTPTRTALMTGKSPQRLGIYRQFAKNATHGLPTAEKTLADYLGQAGYQTWLTGKWHLGHARREYHPNSRGFDHFYGHVTGGIGYWDHVHGGGLDWQRNGQTLRQSGYSTQLLADEAVSLIQQRDSQRPFFLYASFNAPHLPNEAPPAAVDAYAAMREPRRTHAAMVSELDSAIGRIVAELRQQELLENTMIWFMSDNGGLNQTAVAGGMLDLAETLDEWFTAPLPVTLLEFVRTNALDGGSDNLPFRFGKGSVYEGGARVPSLAYWPGVLAPGQVEAMVTVQDVLPTILAATRLAIPEDLDGISRWPLLRAGTGGEMPDQEPPPDYVTMGQTGAQAYYQWPYKLIADDGHYELYDLQTDPTETTNLAAAQKARVDALRRRLDAWPRAENLHIPIYRVMWDPDFFGGEEDRPPWTELIHNHPQPNPVTGESL